MRRKLEYAYGALPSSACRVSKRFTKLVAEATHDARTGGSSRKPGAPICECHAGDIDDSTMSTPVVVVRKGISARQRWNDN
jgi:hypothetical protein